MKPRLPALLLSAAALAPAVASAALAVTTGDVNMRAGPDVAYPRVAVLRRGVTVDVVGCLEGWQWCDVIVGASRGFVAASYLSYAYGGYAVAPVVIAQGGPAPGIPLISFSIGTYWDSYYRGRPWWNDRARWYAHRVAPAPAWRPAPGYAYGHDRGRDNDGNGNHGRGSDENGREVRGNGNGPGRDRNGYAAGPVPGPYTRSEGGRYATFGGHAPNDSAHPNAQQ